MATSFKQPFFSRGEISPRLYGRVDTAAYQSGLRTAKNAIVSVGGGVMNRPGTLFIGTAKYSDKYTRLIPFAFKVNDTHMLEFGDEYIRFIREDFYQLDELASNAITNITQATHGVVTSPTHGWSDGDEIRIYDVGGMVEINDVMYIVSDTTTSTFKIKSTITGEYVDTSGFSAFTTTGVGAKVYEIETPYAAEDLPLLKYTQSADVLTLAHPSYPLKELKRFALTDWRLEDPDFVPATDFPVNIAGINNDSDITDVMTYRYQVTAIDDETGIESLPGEGATSYHLTAATKANPCVITTSVAHPFEQGDPFLLTGVNGMVELTDRRFVAGNVTTDTVQLLGIDSSDYTTFTSALTDSVWPLFIKVDSDTTPNVTLTWNGVDGADKYAVYREDNGTYALIGETRKLTFTDDNITANLEEGPPQDFNPFFGEDNYPGAVGYYQQRLIVGGTNNKPDTWYASQPADFHNFTKSFPIKDDDAITATLVSEQVNQIKHFISAGNLAILTGGSEWAVSTGGDPAFTPFTAKSDPQTNWGVAEHKPYLLGSTILFVQQDNRTVRSLARPELQVDGLKSSEISLLSDHLFQDHEIRDWSIARTPYSAVMLTRTDGDAAMLVYNEEQNVIGWTHWDTQGEFQTVASARVCLELETPEPDDGIYFVIKRNINGSVVQFVERLHKRRFSDIRDAFFVDCGVSYDSPYEITNITNQGDGGSYLVTCPSHPFLTDMVVDFADIEWVPDVDNVGNETQPDQLNDTKYVVDTVPTANTFTIREISVVDTPVIPPVGYKLYVKGGTARENTYIVDGLEHLEGMTVSALADGYPLRDLVVEDGEVTLPGLASRIHVGLGYTSDIETLDIEPAMASQSIQQKFKRITKVVVRFDKSRECLIGPNKNNLIPMKRAPFQEQVSAQLFSGDNTVNILPSWGTNGRILFRQLDPMPINILAVFPDMDIST